ncbi:hypothetical protein Ancab_004177 [Ancistrocladus abbreviatus]
MATVTIFPLVKIALKTSANPAVQEVGAALGVKTELQQLPNTLLPIEATLQDAESRQFSNTSVKKWLEELKDVLYDLDDLLDELATAALELKEKKKGSLLKKVSNSFSSLALHSELAPKLKKIFGKLNEVAARRVDLQFNANPADPADTSRNRLGEREVVTLVRPSNCIGRENDEEEMIKRVLTCGDHDTLSVIPIVGAGGMGKTMFAKILSYNEKISSKFQVILWGCLSGKSDLRMIIEDIIKSRTGASSLNLTMEELRSVLHQLLQNNKYFLVLDDVWTEDPREWKRLRDLLDVGAKGSTVMVTTRSNVVASVVGTEKAYVLRRLSDEDCWSVFANYAFNEGDDEKYPSLVEIGRSTVKKCGGVPLAAEIVGSLLSRDRDEQEWQRVKALLEKLREQLDDAVVAAVKLSYEEMPPQLKACFSYFLMFPNDYTVYRDELINTWMAQGLLDLGDQNANLADVGARYFGEMLSRSLFRSAFLIVGAGTGNCKIHDMVSDFIPYIAGDEFATNVNCASVLASEKVRHIGFHDFNLSRKAFPQGLLKAKKARSFMLLGQVGPITKSFLENLISKFSCLRILNLLGSEFDELPSSIGTLKHLRYLSLFSNFSIKRLPDSICKLINLQTLDLRHCEQLKELPREIGKLISLKQLYLTSQLKVLPEKGFKGLISLQVMKLVDCQMLVSLSEGIGYLTALQELHIVRCPRLASLPSSMGTLPALKVLEIVDCKEMDLMEADGIRGLRGLTILSIGNLPKLVKLPGAFQAATSSLQHLMISNCASLTTLPRWLQYFGHLKKLYLYDCANLQAFPKECSHLTNLQYLDIRGCTHLSRRCAKDEGDDWPHISHVPIISLDGNWIQKNKSPWEQ